MTKLRKFINSHIYGNKFFVPNEWEAEVRYKLAMYKHSLHL